MKYLEYDGYLIPLITQKENKTASQLIFQEMYYFTKYILVTKERKADMKSRGVVSATVVQQNNFTTQRCITRQYKIS